VVPLLAFVAGATSGIALLAVWMTVTGGISFTKGFSVEAAKGIEVPDVGITAAISTAVLVVTAFVWLLLGSKRRRALALVCFIAGAVVGACAIYTLVTLDARYVDFVVTKVPTSRFLSASQVTTTVETVLGNGTAAVRPGWGLLVAIAAGGVAMLSGLFGLMAPAPKGSPGALLGESGAGQETGPVAI